MSCEIGGGGIVPVDHRLEVVDARPSPGRPGAGWAGSCQVTVRERSGPQSVSVASWLVGHRVSCWSVVGSPGSASGWCGCGAVGVVGGDGLLAAPGEQGVEGGQQRAAGLGQVVLEAVGAGLVLPALDDAGLGERLEPGGDPVAGRAGAGHDVGEAVGAERELADDEQCPALADDLERRRRWGTAAREVGERRWRAAGAVTCGCYVRRYEFESQTDSPERRRAPADRPLTLVALGYGAGAGHLRHADGDRPQTALDLGAGSGARAWILSSMSVGLAAALLGLGRRRRRRRAAARLRRRLALLGLGSLVCAVAPSSAVFVGARVLEGVGGAAVLACGLAVLAHAFTEPADRARATGIWGASVGLGITAGALLAAGLDIGTGWRETYVVVGLVALALVLPERGGCPSRRPSTRAGSTWPAWSRSRSR